MSDYLNEFHRLLDRAEDQGYLPESGVYLAEASRLAKKHNDTPNAVLAEYLYTFAVAPMQPERALVSFAWCVAHADDAEDVLPYGSIAQLYGIAIGILRSYPTYSLETIEKTFEQMEALYDEQGLDKRDIWHQRIYQMLSIGEREKAREYYAIWKSAEPDPYTCLVCERGTDVLFHLHLEDYTRGMTLAEPILDGRASCEHGQPLLTFAATLVPLIRMGRKADARVNYRASCSLLTHLSYAGIWAAGRQLAYLALDGELDEGLQTLNAYLPTALRSGTPADRYGFLLSVLMMARRVNDEGGDEDRAQLVDIVSNARPPLGTIDAIRAWLETETAELADAFDRRNGNTEYSRIANVFAKIYADARAN